MWITCLLQCWVCKSNKILVMVLYLDNSCYAKGKPGSCFWKFYWKHEHHRHEKLSLLPCTNATPNADYYKYYLHFFYKSCLKTLGYEEYGCLLLKGCSHQIYIRFWELFVFTIVCVWVLCLEIAQSWDPWFLKMLVKAGLLNLSRAGIVLGAFRELVPEYFRRFM